MPYAGSLAGAIRTGGLLAFTLERLDPPTTEQNESESPSVAGAKVRK